MRRIFALLACAALLLTGCSAVTVPAQGEAGPISEVELTSAVTSSVNATTAPMFIEETSMDEEIKTIEPEQEPNTFAELSTATNFLNITTTRADDTTTRPVTINITTTRPVAATTRLTATTTRPAVPAPAGEMRAAWISYFELRQPSGGISEAAFRTKYDALFKQIADFGISTVFLHVFPFSDAIWPSALAPWSHILTGTQGRDPGFDPLRIFCQLADKHNLALHAWFNLLRVTEGSATAWLAQDNRAAPHIASGDGRVRLAGPGWYWNPAVPENHALILGCIREILENYPVAGIHIDDYFYPTTAPEFDAEQFAAYRARGGTKSMADWRREVIDTLVRSIYRTAKGIKPNAIVSISPSGNANKNYNEMYADVALWMREPGYADWIIPQIYFGFEHPLLPFERTARQWAALPRHSGLRLFAGLANYKVGRDDRWAGAARDEWLRSNDIIARQVRDLRTIQGYGGFVFYSANALFGSSLTEIAKQERDNLQLLLN